MLFYINPNVVQNFLRFERSDILPRVPKSRFSARKFHGKRIVGLMIKDQALQAGRLLRECPHVRGTYQRFSEELDWNQTEYVALFEKKYKRIQRLKGKCRTFDDFRRGTLKRWDDVFLDIQLNGFKQARRIEQNVEVALGSSGEVFLIDGRHRLIFAKILGLTQIPVVANLISDRLAQSFLDHKQFFDRQLMCHRMSESLKFCSVSPNEA